ncbi:MAG: bactofilin family protein [Nannocystales bacterium]
MSTPEITTILGQGSSFEGKLTFEGAVRIDGAFKGEIRTQGTLIVGETADIRAEIEGAHVVVHGAVHGDIRALEAVELRTPARVRGNIASPSVEIEKGARFDGSCIMDEDSPAEGAADAPVANDADLESGAEPSPEASPAD